jgi:hypothetical protein
MPTISRERPHENEPHHHRQVAESFGEPEQWRFDWQRSYARDEWLDQLATTGGLTSLPRDKAAQVLDGVGAVVDAIGGSFTMAYATVVVTAVRTSTA